MEIAVKSPKDWLREFEVEIEPERLKAKMEALLDEYKDKAQVPGFRRGRVPKSILERRLGGALESAAVEELIEEVLDEALEKNGVKPASKVKIEDLDVAPDKTVRFRAAIEVVPEFELKPYTGLELKRLSPTGFDEEFEKRLKALQERCALYKPVTRPAQNGDFVVVDYVLHEGEKVVSGPKKNVTLQVGAEGNHPQINEALLNVKPGDERSAAITFPPDHPDKSLAGRTINYSITVRAVRERILPEINEEFAQDLGYENLDALRKAINEEILTERDEEIQDDLRRQVIEHLTKSYDFEPPQSWIEAHLKRLLTEFNLPDSAETREKLLPVATKSARFDCIALRIAQKENITVTDDEIENQIQELARTSGRRPEEIAPLLDNSSYRFHTLQKKVLQLIIDKAEIKG
ncbi:MAG: trigger factor [candidate division WOR-3 bacterium]